MRARFSPLLWHGCRALVLGVAGLTVSASRAAETRIPAADAASDHFTREVAPIFEQYCVKCHSGAKPKGDVVLSFKSTQDAIDRHAGDRDFWNHVAQMIAAKDMPPDDEEKQPSDVERRTLVDWINTDLLAIDCTTPNAGRYAVHRLNNREYANTLRDLLYLPPDLDLTADLPADDRGGGFDNSSNTLTLSPVHIEHYLEIAEKAVNIALNLIPTKELKKDATLPSRSKLNAPGAKLKEDFADRQSKVRLNIEAFAPRAYRRPVSKQEIDELMRFASLAFTHDGESFDKATGLVIRAAIMSPEFLFRMERDPHPDGTGKAFELNDYELASRLSYFLWATMPDDALFERAAQKSLRPELDAEVKRMLQDPKAISLTKDFAGQWLEIRGLEATPNCPPELLKAMRGETEHVFDYIVREDRSIMEFLDADYTFVNGPLARHYGIPNVDGDEFVKVQVDPAVRGGLFTQASFLTLTAKPLEVKGAPPTRRPSPVNRGKWILENIFDQTVPPPPPNVPALEIDDGKELKGTIRQVFEQHRADPKCAGCHARMDPYGFALENYDGLGAWRDKDNGVPVDASGEINGKKFTTPREFRAVLASRRDDFRRAFVSKVLSYALARGLEAADQCTIDEISAAVAKDGDRFSSVILNVIRSYPFQHARGSGAPASVAQAAVAEPTVN